VWKLTVGHRGTRHHRSFEGNEDQAARALAEFADEIHLAARRDAPTLDGLVLGYLDHLATTGYAATTIARYRSLHRQWILPGIGHRRLRRIFNSDVQELLDTMADDGQSPSSIRQARALLAGAYRWAQQRGTVSANPALDIEWPWELN
jgi:site-specific recombinase XerD